MNKRSLGLVGVLVIVSLIINWFVFKQANQFIGTNAFNALPNSSPIIIRVGNTLGFSGKLSDSELWNSFAKLPGGKQMDDKVRLVDSLLIHNKSARGLFKGRPLLLSLNKVGASDVSIQGTFAFESITELKMVKDILRSAIRRSNLVLEKKRYDSYPVWVIRSPLGEPIVYLSFNHGVFIFSDYDIFLEQMIRQLIQEDHYNESVFQPLFAKSTHNRDVKIFLNHKSTNELISMAFCGAFKKGVVKTKHFAKASQLGIRIENQAIYLDGYSMEESNKRDLMSVIVGQTPSRSLMIRELPRSTSYISSVRISDKELFRKNYKRYLIKNHRYDQLHIKQVAVKKKYGFEPFEIFYKILGQEFGILYTQSNSLNQQHNRFFWLDINNVNASKSYMNAIALKMEKILGKKKFNASAKIYKLSKGKDLKIYRSPDPQFSRHVLGYLFGSVDTKYYCFYNSFMLFSSSEEALFNLVKEFGQKTKLVDTESYKTYRRSSNPYGSFSMYMRPRKFIPFWRSNIHRDTYHWLEVEDQTLMKFTSMGWSMYFEDGVLIHEGRLTFDPEYCDEPSKVWTAKLDDKYSGRIFSVKDHTVKNGYRILVQDVKNKLYMFSLEGKRLWSYPLDGPIMGKIKEVDLYRNKKVQYMFNTKHSVYTLDREGHDVDGYPVSLKRDAVNELSVFYYDNRQNVRIFVPVKGKDIVVLNKNGKEISGWSTQSLTSDIVGIVQHFEVGKKDYIIYSDSEKSYLVDRRGRIRNNGVFYFNKSKNNRFYLEEDISNLSSHLVTTSSDGMVYRLFFDGSIRKQEVTQMSNSHKFIKEDIDLDGKSEYIYVDHNKTSVFDKFGVLKWQKRIPNSDPTKVKVIHISPNNMKMGILGGSERKIHWINEDGSEMSGFPLYGKYNFVIGKHGYDNKKLDLISGDDNCNVFKYEVN